MIGKLKGYIEEVNADHLLIDVNGVCYIVLCSANSRQSVTKGDSLSIFIETYVREDQITLFGFISLHEKQLFLQLITVKGVGPKMALAILGGISPEKLSLAIASEDKAAFSAISGVGPKLATRIISELKDKEIFVEHNFSDEAANSSKNISDTIKSSDDIQNAVMALQNLGVSRSEAYANVTKIASQNAEISLSELIKLSLKQISK